MIPVDKIETRARAINLSLKDIAKAAGTAPSTAYRAAGGLSDARGSTSRKLSEALIALEISQRDYLIALHGMPAQQGEAA